jgi:hypothetical protein
VRFPLIILVETLPHVDPLNLADFLDIDPVTFQQVSDLSQHLFLRRGRAGFHVVR